MKASSSHLAVIALLGHLVCGERASGDECPVASFAASHAFYVGGSYPYSIAAGDFNHDGKMDLAVASSGFRDPSNQSVANGNISVLLGRGDGTFTVPVNYSSGISPQAVVVADLNGDGNADLVVANSGSDSVSVLLGNGDGTFRTASDYRVGTSPQFVAVGDFNNDGKSDLAVANFGSANISILLGNGDGTFKTAVQHAAGTNPSSASVGDFNSDGKPDLIVVNSGSSNFSVLLGKGDGTFQAGMTVLSVGGYYSVVADFNGDGKADLAVANRMGPLAFVRLFLGKGDGTFQAAVIYRAGKSSGSLALADLNRDGNPDLVFANSQISVLLGKSDGTFQAAIILDVGLGSSSLAVADFNGDGQPDIAVTTSNGGGSVLLSRGDGTFQTTVNYATGSLPGSLVAGDFNGDGKSDLAVASLGTYDSRNFGFTNGGVFMLLGKSEGVFETAVKLDAGGAAQSVAAGDFDGDGKLDVAVANLSTNVVVLLGKGDGTLKAPVRYGVYGYAILVSDFNLDGKPDMAVATASVSVLLGNGDGSFQNAVSYGPRSFPQSIAVGDFNGDGNPDLVTASVAGFFVGDNGMINVLLGNGDGSFEDTASYEVGQVLSSVAVGDFDGDRKLDLVVVDSGTFDDTSGTYTNTSLSILLGQGDGTFQNPVTFYAGQSPPSSVTVADFNGDGKTDLAVGTSTFGGLLVFLGQGDGTFQAAVNFATGAGTGSASVGDFNSDGKPDIAVANSLSLLGSVSVLLNTCGSSNAELSIARNNAAVTLSWPFPSTGFVLESASSLRPANWQATIELPIATNGRWQVTVPTSQGERYFRLHKP